MIINFFRQFAKHGTAWRIAVILSSISVGFGIFREFLIIWLLGFSALNDRLQLYLSIFYTIGLSIDAMRLSCLNLYSVLSLNRLLLSASIIGLPFAICIGVAMSYAMDSLDLQLLIISIAGSYLNLIAAMLITYAQRNHFFLAGQFVNVIPNLILIPGILMCYWYFPTHLIYSIVCLTSLIPVAQCIALLLLVYKHQPVIDEQATMTKSITTFARHFTALTGEQLFQIIIRSAFYRYGTGYLSVYAMSIRIYSAIRFVLIDSFIGSRLAQWQHGIKDDKHYFSRMINSTALTSGIAAIALTISLKPHSELFYSAIQMSIILVFGFYLSTLVRIIYFKINRYENNPGLVLQFAAYEMLCALFALLLAVQFNYPILAMLWLGYIAKPFAQILLLRKRYQGLESSEG